MTTATVSELTEAVRHLTDAMVNSPKMETADLAAMVFFEAAQLYLARRFGSVFVFNALSQRADSWALVIHTEREGREAA